MDAMVAKAPVDPEKVVEDVENLSLSPYGPARASITEHPLTDNEVSLMTDYFHASMYMCLGMIYLRQNPLLRDPLTIDHLKRRLLGHWGSDAGQSFTYIHMNRLIKKYDLDTIFISGPGHGAPAVLSNSYLEGVYSEVYPEKSEDENGMRRFFKSFSFPGGIGYSISHAFGTVFDHPDLIALTMVGDGESETGPLATSWHSTKFLNPITDGAVLPVLHLNGYKVYSSSSMHRLLLTDSRSIIRPYSRVSATRSLKLFSLAVDGLHTSSRAAICHPCTKPWPQQWSAVSRKFANTRRRLVTLERHSGLAGL
jgi:xylulose-5-phosphate/fructose-6-phosphate phosphoketolase